MSVVEVLQSTQHTRSVTFYVLCFFLVFNIIHEITSWSWWWW